MEEEKEPRTVSLPCGCRILWDDANTAVAFCTGHSSEYQGAKNAYCPEAFFMRYSRGLRGINTFSDELKSRLR
ncbi:MAG: hypothetical protein ABI361_09895 [Nitrososphaera sp.]